MKRIIPLVLMSLMLFPSCKTVTSKPDSYYLSEQYIAELNENEDPLVMDYFYRANDSLSEAEYKNAINYATKGMDHIPIYRDVFAYFYAVRGYSYIMLYDLDSALDDIKNLENLDRDSLMIPFLYTYYYLSMAPFDSDPDFYYQNALRSLKEWREEKPENYLETFFSDPRRISEIEKVILEDMNR